MSAPPTTPLPTTPEAADDLIAAALRGPVPWPDADADIVLERAVYHGVAALLTATPDAIAGWPDPVRAGLRQQALGRAMWELRHRAILMPVLAALAERGIAAVLLKGTAMAYLHYPVPALRTRGDSDLLVPVADLPGARQLLRDHGFVANTSIEHDAVILQQESWTHRTADGSSHDIDLHGEVFTGPAMLPVLGARRALAEAVAVPALGPDARALPLPLALLHACLHRGLHVVSPYFVAGRQYFGGDRFIWLKDVDLMLAAMDDDARAGFVAEAARAGVGGVCAEALRCARVTLGTAVPEPMLAALQAAPESAPQRYLTKDRNLGRVVENLRALPGLGVRLGYAYRLLLPSETTMRAKYPDLAGRPLIRLHARRVAALLRKPGGSAS